MTVWRTAIGWALAALAGITEPTAVPAETTVDRADGSIIVTTPLPGRLVDWTLVGTDEGRREIALLVAPVPDGTASKDASVLDEDENDRLPPCPDREIAVSQAGLPSLFRLEPSVDGSLELLAADLSPDCSRLVGRLALVLVTCGDELLGFDLRDRELTRLEQHDDLQAEHVYPGAESAATLATAGKGILRVHGPIPEGQAWEPLAEVELPVRGGVRRDGIWIEPVLPQQVHVWPDGAVLYATPPERYGSQRLMVRRIDVDFAGAVQVTESWARLPQPEEPIDRGFAMLGGRPVLIVATRPTEKLGLFGEKRLRVYPLERDRSRLGLEPVLATKSRMNLWQEATFRIQDVNMDGAEDLVVGYWKGLSDSKIVLDVYLGNTDGGFAATPRTTAFNVENGDRSFVDYGHDIDGDGLPDLLVGADKRLIVYPGLLSSDGRKLVDKGRPRVVPLGEQAGESGYVVATFSFGRIEHATISGDRKRPRVADLDADGRSELLVIQRGGHDGGDVFRVILPEQR